VYYALIHLSYYIHFASRVFANGSIITRFLFKLPETIINKIKSKPNSPKSKKVRAGRIMDSRFGKALQSIGDKIKPKLTKAATFAKEFMKRFEPIAALGSAGKNTVLLNQ